MNKKLLLCLLPGLAFTNFAEAADGNNAAAWKQSATLVSSALLGAAVAGPLGIVGGLIGGNWLGEQIDRSDRLDLVSLERDMALRESQEQGEQLAQLERRLENLDAALASRLEFQVLFATGGDELQELDIERLQMLAGYLLRNQELRVRLDGYADPRGTDEYNNVLAMYRAQNVAAELNALGVPKSRIEIHHHGASTPPGNATDLDAYAMQRRVDIEVFQPQVSAARTASSVAMDP